MNYIWVTLEKISTVLLKVIALIILARLLSPDDFGIFAVVAIIGSISLMLVDSGMGGSLIQKNEVHDVDYSTVFIFNLLISIFFCIVIFFLSPLIASYMSLEELKSSIRVASIVIIIRSLALVQIAYLNRNLRFKKQLLIYMSSYSISIVVAIYMAFNGFGYWSLVWQQIIEAAISTVLFYYKSSIKIRCMFSFKILKLHFEYGSFLLLSSFFRIGYISFIPLYITKTFGVTSAGLYSQAYKISELTSTTMSSIIEKVAFPMFSRSVLKKKELDKSLLKHIEIVIVVSLGMATTISFYSESLVYFLLGAGWAESSTYLSILIFSVVGICYESVIRSILKARGFVKEIFMIELIKRPIFIALLIVFSGKDISHTLILFVLLSLISPLINIVFTSAKLGYKSSDLMTPCIVPMICAVTILYLVSTTKFGQASIYYWDILIKMPLMFIAYIFLCSSILILYDKLKLK